MKYHIKATDKPYVIVLMNNDASDYLPKDICIFSKDLVSIKDNTIERNSSQGSIEELLYNNRAGDDSPPTIAITNF